MALSLSSGWVCAAFALVAATDGRWHGEKCSRYRSAACGVSHETLVPVTGLQQRQVCETVSGPNAKRSACRYRAFSISSAAARAPWALICA